MTDSQEMTASVRDELKHLPEASESVRSNAKVAGCECASSARIGAPHVMMHAA